MGSSGGILQSAWKTPSLGLPQFHNFLLPDMFAHLTRTLSKNTVFFFFFFFFQRNPSDNKKQISISSYMLFWQMQFSCLEIGIALIGHYLWSNLFVSPLLLTAAGQRLSTHYGLWCFGAIQWIFTKWIQRRQNIQRSKRHRIYNLDNEVYFLGFPVTKVKWESTFCQISSNIWHKDIEDIMSLKRAIFKEKKKKKQDKCKYPTAVNQN